MLCRKSCRSSVVNESLMNAVFFLCTFCHILRRNFWGNAPKSESYVYWTVHHLDSWVKSDQLDATCFIITLFSAQHVSDVNTSILRSLWLIFWVISWVVSGSMCVGVTLQCGYGGVVSVCRQKPAYRYHTTTATLQRNTNTHRTRAIQPMK